jgi:hypothetical protein
MGRVGTALVLAIAALPLVCASASANPGLGALPIVGGHGASAAVSNAAPGARPVALTIRLHAELQCGRFDASSITVSLPTSMDVPSSISKVAVVVAGKAAGSVQTSGTRVVIHPAAPKPGAICDVIGPGVVAIKFTRLAGLGNPPHAGSYTLGVVAQPRGGEWHAVLAIH